MRRLSFLGAQAVTSAAKVEVRTPGNTPPSFIAAPTTSRETPPALTEARQEKRSLVRRFFPQVSTSEYIQHTFIRTEPLSDKNTAKIQFQFDNIGGWSLAAEFDFNKTPAADREYFFTCEIKDECRENPSPFEMYFVQKIQNKMKSGFILKKSGIAPEIEKEFHHLDAAMSTRTPEKYPFYVKAELWIPSASNKLGNILYVGNYYQRDLSPSS